MSSIFVALQPKNQRVSEDANEVKKYWKCCEDGLARNQKSQLSATQSVGFCQSLYNDNLMKTSLSFALWHYSSRSREFQKAQVGSNERKCCRDGLETKKWSVVSDIVGEFLLVHNNKNLDCARTHVRTRSLGNQIYLPISSKKSNLL